MNLWNLTAYNMYTIYQLPNHRDFWFDWYMKTVKLLASSSGISCNAACLILILFTRLWSLFAFTHKKVLMKKFMDICWTAKIPAGTGSSIENDIIVYCLSRVCLATFQMRYISAEQLSAITMMLETQFMEI